METAEAQFLKTQIHVASHWTQGNAKILPVLAHREELCCGELRIGSLVGEKRVQNREIYPRLPQEGSIRQSAEKASFRLAGESGDNHFGFA